MKTFSFPKNSISGKWNIFRKCFYMNQTQPKFLRHTFSKLFHYGGKRLKIGIVCMKEYSKKAGCHPKRCLMVDWEWKKCEDMAALMAS